MKFNTTTDLELFKERAEKAANGLGIDGKARVLYEETAISSLLVDSVGVIEDNLDLTVRVKIGDFNGAYDATDLDLAFAYYLIELADFVTNKSITNCGLMYLIADFMEGMYAD